ncbi:MAG: hypothetical protein JW725_02975 [Candidatus Babeliaceae bacterium]|nr:hypothetical protein [Candidatus Babeliaceae bacterium]
MKKFILVASFVLLAGGSLFCAGNVINPKEEKVSGFFEREWKRVKNGGSSLRAGCGKTGTFLSGITSMIWEPDSVLVEGIEARAHKVLKAWIDAALKELECLGGKLDPAREIKIFLPTLSSFEKIFLKNVNSLSLSQNQVQRVKEKISGLLMNVGVAKESIHGSSLKLDAKKCKEVKRDIKELSDSLTLYKKFLDTVPAVFTSEDKRKLQGKSERLQKGIAQVAEEIAKLEKNNREHKKKLVGNKDDSLEEGLKKGPLVSKKPEGCLQKHRFDEDTKKELQALANQITDVLMVKDEIKTVYDRSLCRRWYAAMTETDFKDGEMLNAVEWQTLYSCLKKVRAGFTDILLPSSNGTIIFNSHVFVGDKDLSTWRDEVSKDWGKGEKELLKVLCDEVCAAKKSGVLLEQKKREREMLFNEFEEVTMQLGRDVVEINRMLPDTVGNIGVATTLGLLTAVAAVGGHIFSERYMPQGVAGWGISAALPLVTDFLVNRMAGKLMLCPSEQWGTPVWTALIYLAKLGLAGFECGNLIHGITSADAGVINKAVPIASSLWHLPRHLWFVSKMIGQGYGVEFEPKTLHRRIAGNVQL